MCQCFYFPLRKSSSLVNDDSATSLRIRHEHYKLTGAENKPSSQRQWITAVKVKCRSFFPLFFSLPSAFRGQMTDLVDGFVPIWLKCGAARRHTGAQCSSRAPCVSLAWHGARCDHRLCHLSLWRHRALSVWSTCSHSHTHIHKENAFLFIYWLLHKSHQPRSQNQWPGINNVKVKQMLTVC